MTNQKFSVRDLMTSLRDGGPFTSFGCYPKFWYTADGGVLSYAAVKENLLQIARAVRDENDKQWQIIGCEANWENPELYCDHTGERIESAYADDETETGDSSDE